MPRFVKEAVYREFFYWKWQDSNRSKVRPCTYLNVDVRGGPGPIVFPEKSKRSYANKVNNYGKKNHWSSKDCTEKKMCSGQFECRTVMHFDVGWSGEKNWNLKTSKLLNPLPFYLDYEWRNKSVAKSRLNCTYLKTSAKCRILWPFQLNNTLISLITVEVWNKREWWDFWE